MPAHRVLSFKYAIEGLLTAFNEQPNLKFHLLAALLVIFLGLFFQITSIEWLVLIFCIGLVISLELTNSAIESIVDSFTEEHHPAAKKAKDIAAASVLVASITTLIIGLLIFFPHIY